MATDDAINQLMTKLMTDRYCRKEMKDFEACVLNFVPQHGGDNSHVEHCLQRKGLLKCQPYKELLQKCLGDDKKQTLLTKQAASMPECKEERTAYAQCQRKGGQNCE